MKKVISIILCLLFISALAFTEDITVYITKTGSKYHTATCSSLRSSRIPINLSDALEQGYEPCGRCKPPVTASERSDVYTPTAVPEVDKEALALPYCADQTDIISHTGYSLLYSEAHEQALWVAYLLTSAEVSGEVGRTDNFNSDPDISTGSASKSDYRGSGYDRGHLAPAADMKWSIEAMKDSFYLSNMSPQLPGFNRGIWKQLEAWVRECALECEELYIVTGPILTDGPYQKIGDNEVSIPKHYYKVLLDYAGSEIKAIGFILPNQSSKASLSEFAVSVDGVEEITGIDFFYLLEDDVEGALESYSSYSKW